MSRQLASKTGRIASAPLAVATTAVLALAVVAGCYPRPTDTVRAICIEPPVEQEKPQVAKEIGALLHSAREKKVWSQDDDGRFKRLLYKLPLETRLRHTRTLVTLVNLKQLTRQPLAQSGPEPPACSCQCAAPTRTGAAN